MRATLRVTIDYSLDNFEVIEWHKSVGDRIGVGDFFLTCESQKGTFECQAEVAGTLVEITAQAGAVVSKSDGENPDDWNIVGYLETG